MPLEINKNPLSEAKTLLCKVLSDKGLPLPLMMPLVHNYDGTFPVARLVIVSLSDIIRLAFPWVNSPQGFKYWSNVYRNMLWLEKKRSINISSPQ